MASENSPPDVSDVSSPAAPGPGSLHTPPAFVFARLLEPQYVFVVVSALSIIWVGAHGSIRRPPSAAPSKLKKGEKRREEEKFEGALVASDAIRAPILLAVVLVGLYYLIQWLQDPAILNKILRGYMSVMSLAGLATLSGDALDNLVSIVFPSIWADGSGQIHHIDPERRCQYVVDEKTGTETIVKGKETPLPGRLANLAPSANTRRFLWGLRHSLNAEWTLRIAAHGTSLLKLHLRLIDLLRFAIAGTVAVAYHWSGWHILSNLLSAAMCYVSFMLLSPTSFSIGTMFLASLFVYDVVMVFYTPYMITVAKNIDAPIKLVFVSNKGASMLGLGDIVVPGMVMALALRFDLYRYYQKQIKNAPLELRTTETASSPSAESPAPTTTTTTTITTRRLKTPYTDPRGQWGNRFWTTPLGKLNPIPSALEPLAATAYSKPYFHASLAGYAAGMLVTLVAMLVYNHGQPALLYLVPGVAGALWLTGAARGELGEMWGYTEDGSLDMEDVVVEVDGEGRVVDVRGEGEGEKEGEEKEMEKRGEEAGYEDRDAKSDGAAEPEEGKGRPYELFVLSITVPRAAGVAC